MLLLPPRHRPQPHAMAVPRGYVHGGDIHRGCPVTSSAAARPSTPLPPAMAEAAVTFPAVVSTDMSMATSHAAIPYRHIHAGTTAIVLWTRPHTVSLICGGVSRSTPPLHPWPRTQRHPPPDHCLCGGVHLSRPRRRRPARLSCGLVCSDCSRSSSPPGPRPQRHCPRLSPRGRTPLPLAPGLMQNKIPYSSLRSKALPPSSKSPDSI